MKKLIPLLALSALVLVPNLSRADEPKPHGEKGPGDHGRMEPGERLKMMTEKLGLTAEQQEKVKAILEKNAPKFKEAMAKGRENLSEEEKTKVRELMKEQMEEIGAVLTPEQRQKMMEARRNREGGDKGGKPAEGAKK